jgi:DhnA family fructose-bisphosphate aldolase class Ia
VERSRVPVVILGGTEMGNTEDILRTALGSVKAGGRGIVFGRAVWQNERMRELIRALKETDEKPKESARLKE